MASPSDSQNNEPEREIKTLATCTKRAGRNIRECAICVGPIGMHCESLLHVARCQTINDVGKPCNTVYSTKYGCCNHPYREGHNPDMKEYADSIKVVIPGAPANPSLVKLEKLCADWRAEHPEPKDRPFEWYPYDGTGSQSHTWHEDPKEIAAWMKREELKIAQKKAEQLKTSQKGSK